MSVAPPPRTARSSHPGRFMAVLCVALVINGAKPVPARGQAEAEGLSASFRKASQRVLPAVVTVRPTASPAPIAPRRPLANALGLLNPSPLPPDVPDNPGGSGVVIDAARGLILTNDHVLNGSAAFAVVLPDGRQRPVKLVRRDPRSDLALLTIDPPAGLQQADWGDSDGLDTGDWVLAVGQPFGLSGTVTAGIVSSKDRGLGGPIANEDLIQTDAAINPGNSGGPLVNLKGEVVGINIALKTLGGGYEGVGFAIPADRARRVAKDLAEQGRVRRAYLGVQVEPVDPDTAERLGLTQPGAVRVTAVSPGSPAEAVGILPGDLIVKVKDRPIRTPSGLRGAVEFAPLGEPLALTLIRDGQTREAQVQPQALPEAVEPLPAQRPEIPTPQPEPELLPRPADRLEQLDTRSPTRFPELGLRLDEPTAALVRRFDLDPNIKGLVVVGVEPDGPADHAGLELGMVITDAAHRKVTSLADFRTALAKRPEGQDLVLRILKGNRAGFRVILDRTGERAEPESPGPARGTEPNGADDGRPAASTGRGAAHAVAKP